MTEEISEEVKNEIFRLVSTPGVEIEDEYLKHNLDYGRRLCCRF